MYFHGDEDKETLKNFIRDNGFLVIRNALSPSEIDILNELFGEIFESNKLTSGHTDYLPGASHIIPEFKELIVSPKLINALKKVCDGDLAYTSHSDLHNGLASGWHKDDGGGGYFGQLTDYFENNEVQVYKVGLYLQDCTENGGLSVRKGSHKQLHDIHHDSLLTSNRCDDDQVYIPSRVGDAVIFDVRITHKGWYPEISFARKFFTKILKRVGFKIPIKVPFQKKSVFFSYGANNKYTKEFALKNMERQVKQNGYDISVMPPTLRSTLEQNIIKYYF